MKENRWENRNKECELEENDENGKSKNGWRKRGLRRKRK